jgi:ABC-type transporter Mla subunit MlaD
MSDPLRYTESKPQTRRRWVRIVVIVAVLVVLVVVVMMLIGGGGGPGGHGPRRHTGAITLPEV